MKSSTRDLVKEIISRKKRGKLIFPENFRDTGTLEAIRLALHRLERDEYIKRVAHLLKTNVMKNLLTVPLLLFVLACANKKDRTPDSGIIGSWQISDVISDQGSIEEMLLLYAFQDDHLTSVEISEKEIKYMDTEGKVIEASSYVLSNEKITFSDKDNTEMKIHLLDEDNFVLSNDSISIKLTRIRKE